MEELLARSFFRLSRYDQAAGHGEAAIANKKSRNIYEILWESYFQQGNLLKAGNVAEDYLFYCRDKHLCDSGLNFVKKLKEVGLFQDRFSVIALELEILRGNKVPVIKRLKELERLWDESISGEILCYQSCIYLHKRHWEREDIVRKIFLQYWREGIEREVILAADIMERKKIIYFILIDFLLGGDEFGRTLEAYASVFEKKYLLEYFEEYKNEKSSLQTHCAQRNEKLAEERDVPNEEVSGVLETIHLYSLSSDEDKNDRIGVCFDGLNEDFLVENAENLLIGLMGMKLYDDALKLFDRIRVRIRKESIEYQINMAYMEVVLLARSGKHYQALDMIQDTLALLPVKAQEQDMFLKEKDILEEKIDLFRRNV